MLVRAFVNCNEISSFENLQPDDGKKRGICGLSKYNQYDALCVVRCLVAKRFLIAGGGAPEIELSKQLGAWAKVLHGIGGYCIREFAEALEVIPYTLAKNAGLNLIVIVTELRNRHAQGEINAGINVRKGQITNILEENVVQPLLVSTSSITLATKCVRMILKIDDIVTMR
ncbi:unnamed protein product [Lathyrus sativus]|nr:unnamed protein product [Lathyrus sativus]